MEKYALHLRHVIWNHIYIALQYNICVHELVVTENLLFPIKIFAEAIVHIGCICHNNYIWYDICICGKQTSMRSSHLE